MKNQLSRNFSFLKDSHFSDELIENIVELQRAAYDDNMDKAIINIRLVCERMVKEAIIFANIENYYKQEKNARKLSKVLFDRYDPDDYIKNAFHGIRTKGNENVHVQPKKYYQSFSKINLVTCLKNIYIFIKWIYIEIMDGDLDHEHWFDENIYLTFKEVEQGSVITKKDQMKTSQEVANYGKRINMTSYPIGRFIIEDSRRYTIPVYQRAYRWEKEMCEILFKDLEKLIEKNKEEHFFGTIATTTTTVNNYGLDHKIVRLIDGRQRITTSILLLKAFVDALKIKKQKIAREYTEFFSRSPSELIQMDYDADNNKLAFEIIIKNNEVSFEKIKNSLNQYNEIPYVINYLWFLNKILNLEDANQINKYLNNFFYRFTIGIISIDCNRVEEMVIFESINSKGTGLTTIELIKNTPHQYLEDSELSSNPWKEAKISTEFEELFSGFTNNKKNKDKYREEFIEAFIKSKTAKIIKKSQNSINKELLEKYNLIFENFLKDNNYINNNTISIENYISWLNYLKRYAELFNSIKTKSYEKDKSNIWYPYRYFIKKSSKFQSSILPIILSVIDSFATYKNGNWTFLNSNFKKSFHKLMLALEKHWLFVQIIRGQGISDSSTYLSIIDILKDENPLNMAAATTHYLEGSHKIEEGNTTPKLHEVLIRLGESNVTEGGRGSAVTLLLLNLHKHLLHKNPNYTYPETIHPELEHICPQELKLWINDLISRGIYKTPEEAEKKLQLTNQMLGNLTILPNKINAKASNKKLKDKIKKYGDKSLHPTLSGEYTSFDLFKDEDFEWNSKRIKERTKDLLKLIEDFYK